MRENGLYYGSMSSGMSRKAMRDLIGEQEEKRNSIVLGESGGGKAFHPWDILNMCTCGGTPFMEGNNGDFRTGAPYRIVCQQCGKTTKYSKSIAEIKLVWSVINGKDPFDMTSFCSRLEQEEEAFFEELLMKFPILNDFLEKRK